MTCHWTIYRGSAKWWLLMIELERAIMLWRSESAEIKRLEAYPIQHKLRVNYDIWPFLTKVQVKLQIEHFPVAWWRCRGPTLVQKPAFLQHFHLSFDTPSNISLYAITRSRDPEWTIQKTSFVLDRAGKTWMPVTQLHECLGSKSRLDATNRPVDSTPINLQWFGKEKHVAYANNSCFSDQRWMADQTPRLAGFVASWNGHSCTIRHRMPKHVHTHPRATYVVTEVAYRLYSKASTILSMAHDPVSRGISFRLRQEQEVPLQHLNLYAYQFTLLMHQHICNLLQDSQENRSRWTNKQVFLP